MSQFSPDELLMLAEQCIAEGTAFPEWLARELPAAAAESERLTRERMAKRAAWKAEFVPWTVPVGKQTRYERWKLAA